MTEHEIPITDYISMCEWYTGLPAPARAIAEKFTPFTKWTLIPGISVLGFEEGDWFQVAGVSSDGTLVMARFKALEGVCDCTVEGVPPQVLRRLVAH